MKIRPLITFSLIWLSAQVGSITQISQAYAASSGQTYHMPTDTIIEERTSTNASSNHLPESDIKDPVPTGVTSLAFMFRGVDTVVVDEGTGPHVEHLAITDYRRTVSVMTDALRDVVLNPHFINDVSRIQIKSLNEIRDSGREDQYKKPNVLLVTFVLSARQEHIDGKAINVGALTWIFRRFDSTLTFSGAGDGVSYPFVIPDSQDELMKHIRAGVLYLAPNLPNQIVCANKIPPECRDCALDCPMSHKYVEKPRVMKRPITSQHYCCHPRATIGLR